MAASIENRKAAAKQLAELLKEFAREEAKNERENLHNAQSARLKALFGKHLQRQRLATDIN
jgi:hypothetical protein